MKAYFYNYNTCTRVKLYGNDCIELVKINGWEIVSKVSLADYIFINTCSFLESKSAYFLSFIRNIYQSKSDGQTLIIIGCLGGTHLNDIMDIGRDIIVFKRDIYKIKEYFNFDKIPKSKSTCVKDKLSVDKLFIYWFNKIFLHSKHIEYRLKRNKVCYLQISSGCKGKCSYCSEKFITHLKSRSIEEILNAIKDGISRGYRLFGLNSDDASCYGLDIGSSLEELLECIVKIDKKIYFSIPEFNPNGLTDKVIELLCDKKFLYITIPIQSGSNRILKKMRRPYNIDDVLEKIKKLKKNNSHIKINTHVIVGFPGETDDDFMMTKNVLSSKLFDRVKVFMYNDRPNTQASKMDNKVSDNIKLERRSELLNVMKRVNIKKFSITNLILNREQLK